MIDTWRINFIPPLLEESKFPYHPVSVRMLLAATKRKPGQTKRKHIISHNQKSSGRRDSCQSLRALAPLVCDDYLSPAFLALISSSGWCTIVTIVLCISSGHNNLQKKRENHLLFKEAPRRPPCVSFVRICSHCGYVVMIDLE